MKEVRIHDAPPLDEKLMEPTVSEGGRLFFVSVATDRLSVPQWMTPCLCVPEQH